MLQAMNTGHTGSMSTIHANGARDALARLEAMVLMAGNRPPARRRSRADLERDPSDRAHGSVARRLPSRHRGSPGLRPGRRRARRRAGVRAPRRARREQRNATSGRSGIAMIARLRARTRLAPSGPVAQPDARRPPPRSARGTVARSPRRLDGADSRPDPGGVRALLRGMLPRRRGARDAVAGSSRPSIGGALGGRVAPEVMIRRRIARAVRPGRRATPRGARRPCRADPRRREPARKPSPRRRGGRAAAASRPRANVPRPRRRRRRRTKRSSGSLRDAACPRRCSPRGRCGSAARPAPSSRA